MDYDVLLAKASTVQRCITRISQTLEGDFEKLREYDAQDVVVLNLQRAVQAVLDMAAHLGADLHGEVPRTLKEHFRLLGDAEVIDRDLEKRLVAMVGFRNIAVHNYEQIDVHILQSIVEHHLKDLEEFCRIALHRGMVEHHPGE
jgi:uncharacterized protein YutE (UPF0331/DUF86 family)